MKLNLLLLVGFLFLVCAHEHDFKDENGVLVLTKETFDLALNKTKYLLVEFCKLSSSFSPSPPFSLFRYNFFYSLIRILFYFSFILSRIN